MLKTVRIYSARLDRDLTEGIEQLIKEHETITNVFNYLIRKEVAKKEKIKGDK
ncbi:hypothetical protein [Cetobacterium sp.]|uniref:hypothetical protein n=1 Tax=Cetobacterium sp. TaxID=2071632 RepID=UPI003F358215